MTGRRGGPVLGPRHRSCVLGALGLLFAKKAVHAALGIALMMINLGVFYIAQRRRLPRASCRSSSTPAR